MSFRRRALLVLAVALAPLLAGAIWGAAVTLRARRDSARLLAQARARLTDPLRLAALSAWQQDALLRVEDPAFYRHHGVDLSTPGQGLTTITQSLVKWIYFEHFRPGVYNKIRQTLIARYALDPALSKPSQLELFVNLVYLGSVDGAQVTR